MVRCKDLCTSEIVLIWNHIAILAVSNKGDFAISCDLISNKISRQYT